MYLFSFDSNRLLHFFHLQGLPHVVWLLSFPSYCTSQMVDHLSLRRRFSCYQHNSHLFRHDPSFFTKNLFYCNMQHKDTRQNTNDYRSPQRMKCTKRSGSQSWQRRTQVNNFWQCTAAHIRSDTNQMTWLCSHGRDVHQQGSAAMAETLMSAQNTTQHPRASQDPPTWWVEICSHAGYLERYVDRHLPRKMHGNMHPFEIPGQIPKKGFYLDMHFQTNLKPSTHLDMRYVFERIHWNVVG